MTAEELATILYQKMKAEQNIYRDWLLSLSPAEVLDHAYEYSTREDILMALDAQELSVEQTVALLESPSPLDDIYQVWQDQDAGYIVDIQGVIEERANEILSKKRANTEKKG